MILVVAVFVIYEFYYFRWRHLWSEDKPFSAYKVEKRNDDTVRVLVIGDSWAAMHSSRDSILSTQIQTIVTNPVMVTSKGRGGENSRGIYRLLFNNDSSGIKSLIKSGADYCVIFAGINDAAANLGVKQFLHHYKLILNFLIENDIRPIVIEVPDVDIWHVNCKKT